MSPGSRYLVTFLFTLSLIVLAVAGAAGAAERGAEHRDPARWAGDAVALRQAGWSLAALETVSGDGAAGAEGAVDIRMTLVDPARGHAVRLDLSFADGGEHVVDYARSSVVVPEERRVYDQQDALFDSLAHGAVQRLYEECGTYVLGLVDGDAVIDEYGWHVVKRSVSGKRAGAALAAELRSGLAAGAHVADVRESADGVDFVLVGDSTQVIQARLDEAGHVVAIEVRESPGAWQSGKLTSEGKLARALAHGKAVRGVSLSMVEGTARVRIDFTRGKGYVIDLADLQYDDEGCGC
jgi:hypothetical protein